LEELWGFAASLAAEDGSVEEGSDVSVFDELVEDGDGFVGCCEGASVFAHEVSDGEWFGVGAFDPSGEFEGFGGGFVGAPLVGDDGHVGEVVVAEFDGVLHGLEVDGGVWLVPCDVEEAGDAEGVGSEFADPFCEVFVGLAGGELVFEVLVPLGVVV